MSAGMVEAAREWLESCQEELLALGLKSSITLGPSDRIPASAWIDFQGGRGSARLTIWDDGQADFMAGDLQTEEILLDEHREISGIVGLEDVRATVVATLL